MSKPSTAFNHFTNRDGEIDRLKTLLRHDLSQRLPTLNFYGVGGAGKSWLCCRMRQVLDSEFPKVKSAHITFDPRLPGGTKYVDDPSEAWVDIAKQLKVPCPQFLLAYAVMQGKQKDTLIEQGKLSKSEASKLEWLGQLASEWLKSEEIKAIAGAVPLLSLIPLMCKRGMDKAAERRLKCDSDFQKLDVMYYSQIYEELLPRLIKDLNDYAPKKSEQQCYSVIFLDTFEELGDATNKSRQEIREAWVRELARGLKRTLVVILGHNELRWGESTRETYWNHPQHLEKHRIEGLSLEDARLFLKRCEITAQALQNEILEGCSCAPESGYFPWTLGLCGDTLWQMREDRGDNTFPPAQEFRFDESEHGPPAVVGRFLRSQSDARRRWIERLAVTLRFDEAAALNAYFAAADERETAWERLQEFSFIVPQATGRWFTLHSHMRNQILKILSPERRQEDNIFWRDYWQSRAAGINP